jgi:hypothetical protein
MQPMSTHDPLEDELDEYKEWVRMTPQERWRETCILWAWYLSVGSSLEPEYDSQSPFNDIYYGDSLAAAMHARPVERRYSSR